MWAAKQENFQPAEKCFFLTSPFIELTGQMPYQDFTSPVSVNQALGATGFASFAVSVVSLVFGSEVGG
jgi:hypothetical protein